VDIFGGVKEQFEKVKQLSKETVGSNVRQVIDLLDSCGYQLEFFHIPTGLSVAFSGFITGFIDSYSSDWNSERVFGRMDPIQGFQGTARVITIDWEVPSDNMPHAKLNLEKAMLLFRMLYPVYDQVAGATGNISSASSMSSSPIFKMKFANLIADASSPRGSAKESGLVGSIAGFKYTPDFESGFYSDGDGFLYPQTIALSADFTVMHTHTLGWRKGQGADDFKSLHFPYNTRGLVEPKVSELQGGSVNTTFDDWWASAAGQKITGA
jgi:hypothetical protein